MNTEKITSVLNQLQFIYGKDCSEYAEDLQKILGGDIMNFVASNRCKFIIDNYNPPYIYHTVLHLDGVIIDYLNHTKQIWDLEEYKEYLNSINTEKIKTIKNLPTNLGW